MILEEVSNLVLRNREDVASNGAFHDRNLPFFFVQIFPSDEDPL